jgi:hypothetical protein
MWEKLPYRLHGDARNWDGAREAHGRAMLSLWTRHAPNLADAVIDTFTRSPLDAERSLPNMREGDLLIGAFINGQIGYDRPFPGAGSIARTSPGFISADRAAIRAATSPACPATTPPRGSSPISALKPRGRRPRSRSGSRRWANRETSRHRAWCCRSGLN